jgi:hypothetical protein
MKSGIGGTLTAIGLLVLARPSLAAFRVRVEKPAPDDSPLARQGSFDRGTQRYFISTLENNMPLRRIQ